MNIFKGVRMNIFKGVRMNIFNIRFNKYRNLRTMTVSCEIFLEEILDFLVDLRKTGMLIRWME